MKYLFYLIFACSLCFGQSDSIVTKKNPKFDAEFRIKTFLPIHFGDNFLAKSNKSALNIGLNLDLLEYNNFIFGAGLDYTYYTITDITRAGDLKTTKLKNFYGNVSYKQKVTDKIDFMPNIGAGYSLITYSEFRFGGQDGESYRIGVNADYKLNAFLCASIGATYVYTKYTINTSPEFVSFYDNSKILQLSLGLKFY
jgi:hypothetical protein